MESEGYKWWIERFKQAFTLADVARIDHFRAFYNYWEIPTTSKSAREGNWRYGPGANLFNAVTAELGDVRIIAEDLGDFDDTSRAGLDELLNQFRFPGMKILQFAFGGTTEAAFLPHNHVRECVVYTGTHDNDTTVGWWRSASEFERHYTRQYLNTDAHDIAWDLIRTAWVSVANTAMTTAQDILRLGNEARMNHPGISGPPNWCWRLQSGALTEKHAADLQEMTRIYARLSPEQAGQATTEQTREQSQEPATEN
jgi:4-alpha-glucanotransferase